MSSSEEFVELANDYDIEEELFYHSFTQVRGKLSLFFHYVDLEDDVTHSSDLIGPNKAQWPLLSHFHLSTT